MSFPYKNPISSIQVNGTQSVPRNNTYGNTFSVNNTGGYMEVFSLSDLYYTIPSGTTGSIEYSGNTIPIEFTKGTGDVWSPDVITLASDNISSGRRRLGMLVYVYEEDQVYQYYINNYETLFNAATASTGCAQVSNFGTTINNKTAAGQSFINAWTGNTIEDVSGATHTTAVWRKFTSGSSSGGTGGGGLYITGTGINSTIRCGVSNTATSDFAAALAGSGNTASGGYSFIGGGVGNTASGSYSFVGGGVGNTSSNYFSTIVGGGFHTSSGFYSTISGGRCNTSSNYNTTVSGGYCNTASNKYSTTGGGFKNTTSGCQSTIGGGVSNIVSSDNSTVGGGASNIVSGYTSTIGGGYCNTLSGSYSFVGGGSLNTSSGYYSFIGGGTQNTISGYPSFGPSFSSILNGCLNSISGTSKIGSYSVIIGGYNNVVSDTLIGVFGSNIVASCPNTFYTNDFCSCGSIYSSALSSGQAVCAGTNGVLTNYTPVSPVIIQGSCTTSSIRCGVSNSATADSSAALAGTGNTASGFASVVVGGFINNTYSTYSFIGAGSLNKVCNCSSSVVGGFSNTACGTGSFIGGGTLNLTSGTTSSIVGGGFNTAGGACSFIGGGNLNTITSGGTFSIIGSGVRNTISGNHGSILGGSGNTVTGSFSSAIGCGLNASANCTLYTNNIITGTISATTYQNLPSFTFTGGTVSGATNFTSGLTVNYIDFDTTPNVPAPTGGTLYFDSTENALSYKPITPSNDVTVNLGQESLIRIYNDLGFQINNGQALHITGSTSGSPTVSLAIGTGGDEVHFQISGIATQDIPNSSFGFMTYFGVVRDINLTGFTVGEQIYLSQTVPGGFSSYSGLSFTGRTCEIGHILDNSVLGKIQVSILNEIEGTIITTQENNILAANNSSTGVFQFSGLSITTPSGTTFNVGAVEGWIIDNTTSPTNPTIKLIIYSGATGITATNVTSATETYILLTSGLTITQQTTFPTPQQRRQNLYLGKFGHANKQYLINAFNEPDSSLSPVSQLRDMFTPIKLINEGVYPSANGVNLNINTSAGVLYGLGLGYITNKLNPNSLSISGTSPCTFQYRTQTGGTASNTTLITPGVYDNNGVVTAVGGGSNSSTNQRIYLVQNGQFRIQYGQQVYGSLAAAIEASQNETFTTFSNFRDNAILIGILSVNKNATNLSNTTQARFLLTSKFGETVGAAGGISTTNLQQAYNNSATPEIVTNSAGGALSIINGTGNADNVTNLLEGQNTAGNVTSFIRADGAFSATTISATTISTPFTTGSVIFQGSGGTLSQNNSNLFWDNANGRLGIGTTLPLSTLDVNGNISIASTGVNLSTNLITITSRAFFGWNGNANSAFMAASDTSKNLSFYGDSSFTTLRARIASGTGNFLINTSTDAGFRLDVNGTVRVVSDARINGITVGLGGGQEPSNTAIGLNALSLNTTGTANTAVGHLALNQNTTGPSNSAFGYLAMRFSTGGSNSAFGTTALFGMTGGSSNSAFGRDAGYYIADGVTAAISLNTSVFIGANTKALANAQSNQIVIGQNAIGLGSNSAVLGNDSITRTALKGDISIGTTGSISSRLQVRGLGATSATTALRVENTNASASLVVNDAGNVLIGSSTDAGFKLDVRGTTRFSASTGTSLTVISSGNSTSTPVFSVQGSQGELFSVTDSLTGSLFSVNDISGLPIMEVFSDNTIVLGDYQAPSLYTTKRVSSITASTGTTIYSFPTSAYTSSFVDYYVSGSTGLRAGSIMAIWSGSSVNFTETSTNDLGSTTPVTFGYVMSGSNAVLRASASTGTWIVESILRGL